MTNFLTCHIKLVNEDSVAPDHIGVFTLLLNLKVSFFRTGELKYLILSDIFFRRFFLLLTQESDFIDDDFTHTSNDTQCVFCTWFRQKTSKLL